MVYQHSGEAAIALYPSKKKAIELIKKIRTIFRESQNLTAYELIVKLNPTIRG